MAPKGGGKGGGSGSKSGSSGSSGKKGRPTNWSKQVRLLGSHFKKPALVASIAVSCLCLLGLLVVAVRAYTVKPNGRKVFLWFGLPLAVTAAVIYLGLDLTDRFLKEFQVTVSESYILIYMFMDYFFLKSSVLLLVVTHSVIRNRFTCIWKSTSRFRAWRLVQYAFVAALTLLWLVDVLMRLLYCIRLLSSPLGTTNVSALTWLERWSKVNTAFHCLYLVAAVDVVVCAVIISNGARSMKVPSSISKYLLTIIAPLLLLRSLVLAVYAIYFNALSHLQTLAADLVGVIFYGVPTVIIFATLVLIANQGDWFPEYQAVQQQPNNNAYPAYPNAYQGETAYQSQTVYVGQKPMEAQPWIPPPPPPGQPGPPGQQYYDTSYHR